MNQRHIEVFCGTGGVGKTTLAASRALQLGEHGLKVLLITIDPSLRLKQVLGLDESETGQVQSLNQALNPQNNVSAILLHPETTLKRLSDRKEDFENRIIKTLIRPSGGLNEIMAVLELQHHLEQNLYDTIILDTPPGKHFIDFLKSTHKITQFFDKTFTDAFLYLDRKRKNKGAKEERGVFGMLIQTGINKLLKYLENVTGPHFLEEFIEAVGGLYRNREAFLKALRLQEELEKKQGARWFLVTSTEQQKVEEALNILSQGQDFMPGEHVTLVNKSILSSLKDWEISSEHEQIQNFKQTLINKENKLLQKIKDFGGHPQVFNEVIGIDSQSHLKSLINQWNHIHEHQN